MVLFQVSWFQLVSCRREIVLVGGTILHGEQSIHLCCSIWFVLEKIRGHSKARSNPWGELKMGFLKALYYRLSIIHFIKIFFFLLCWSFKIYAMIINSPFVSAFMLFFSPSRVSFLYSFLFGVWICLIPLIFLAGRRLKKYNYTLWKAHQCLLMTFPMIVKGIDKMLVVIGYRLIWLISFVNFGTWPFALHRFDIQGSNLALLHSNILEMEEKSDSLTSYLVDITSVIHTFEENHDDLLLAYVSNQ